MEGRNISDAQFILDNYNNQENEPGESRKWTKEEIVMFNELIRSAGKDWRNN